MTKITIGTVELDLPEGVSLDIGRDDDGELRVFVEEQDEDLSVYGPSPTLMDLMDRMDLITSPNPLLRDLAFDEVEARPKTFMGIDLGSPEGDETAIMTTGLPARQWEATFRSMRDLTDCDCPDCTEQRAHAAADNTEEKAMLLGPEVTMVTATLGSYDRDPEIEKLQAEAYRLELKLQIARLKRELKQFPGEKA